MNQIITKINVTPIEAIEAHRKSCLFYKATANGRYCLFTGSKECKMNCSYMKRFVNILNEGTI